MKWMLRSFCGMRMILFGECFFVDCSFFYRKNFASIRYRSASKAVSDNTCMALTGYFPAAVSPVSIREDAPSKTALNMSLTSARVGTGCSSMDASI